MEENTTDSIDSQRIYLSDQRPFAHRQLPSRTSPLENMYNSGDGSQIFNGVGNLDTLDPSQSESNYVHSCLQEASILSQNALLTEKKEHHAHLLDLERVKTSKKEVKSSSN